MAKTVLVVDDSKEIRALLKAYLVGEGFRVVTAADGQEALFAARHEKPDVIILDLLMPVMDGYAFMEAYRREGDAPVIMLTARVEENDKVLGLELGADDYVTKPFSPRELTARLRAVLRRSQKLPVAPEILRAADVTLDRATRIVTVGGCTVGLTPSEYGLLAAFLEAPGRAFTRAELLDRLQGDDFDGFERTIDVHIRNLRLKIEPDPGQPRYVQTIYGVGYRFAPE